MRSFVLVYQLGLGNVVERTGAGYVRVFQHTYRACEYFTDGLRLLGCFIDVKHCDEKGDVLLAVDKWVNGAGDLWKHDKRQYPTPHAA